MDTGTQLRGICFSAPAQTLVVLLQSLFESITSGHERNMPYQARRYTPVIPALWKAKVGLQVQVPLEHLTRPCLEIQKAWEGWLNVKAPGLSPSTTTTSQKSALARLSLTLRGNSVMNSLLPFLNNAHSGSNTT